MLNMAVCTINRFPAMWRTLRRPMAKVGQLFFEQGNHRASFPSLDLSRQETADVTVKILRRQRYQVTTESDSEGTHIYAERNRYARFGTFLSHAGIILAIVAALWGNLAGFSDSSLAIPNGSVRAVGHGTGLSVLNEGFIEEDYPDGRPKDYRSDLVIYENGKEVKRETVRVNEPVEYQGIRFHQAFFGNAAVIRVKDIVNNKLLFEDGVALAYRDEQYGEARPVGFFTLYDGRLNIDVIGTAQDAVDDFIQPWEVGIIARISDNNTILFSEKLAQGEPFAIAGLEFTFLREKQFTGLSVVKNPGVKFIWLASAFMVLGIYTVLYFPYHRIWVLCSQYSQQPTVSLAGVAPRLSGFDGEFQRLLSTFEQELGQIANSRDLSLSNREDGKERSL
jgi:cytochrome c biogenesis protein